MTSNEACNCEACKPQGKQFSDGLMRMVVCSKCGNKRFPGLPALRGKTITPGMPIIFAGLQLRICKVLP
jgi:hypothetical protein